MRKYQLFLLMIALLLALPQVALSQKVKVATPLRLVTHFYLPILAAEEKGFWQAHGLVAEWLPFSGGAAMQRAVVVKAVDIGLSTAPTEVRGASAGVPVIIVAELTHFDPNDSLKIWVQTRSRFKEPKDLRGAKIGVSSLVALEHAYGKLMIQSLGLEGQVRFIASGGLPQTMALFRTGAIEGVVQGISQMVKLLVAGEVRDLVSLAGIIPGEWADRDVFARRDFAQTNPEVLKKAVRAILEAGQFVMQDAAWTMAKMKAMHGYTDEEARLVYSIFKFSPTGQMSKKGLQNLINFLVASGIVSKERAPSAEGLWRGEFLP